MNTMNTNRFSTNRSFWVSLTTHNILYYVAGGLLVLCPYLFGFDGIDAARSLFLIGGLALIAYSLFTRYPYSIAKVIPLGVHMTLDVILGVLLLIGPYALGYNDVITSFQSGVHVVLGITLIALVIFTRPRTESRSGLIEDVTDIRRAA